MLLHYYSISTVKVLMVWYDENDYDDMVWMWEREIFTSTHCSNLVQMRLNRISTFNFKQISEPGFSNIRQKNWLLHLVKLENSSHASHHVADQQIRSHQCQSFLGSWTREHENKDETPSASPIHCTAASHAGAPDPAHLCGAGCGGRLDGIFTTQVARRQVAAAL